MPTYGYECTNCENAFETVQKITDDPLTTCDNCGGTLRKRIFPVGIVFKGSGFYVNDYARKSGDTPAASAKSETNTETSAATDAKSETPASAVPATPAETKTESKPEAAPAKVSSTMEK